MIKLYERPRAIALVLGLGTLVSAAFGAAAADGTERNGRIAWKGFLDTGLTTSAIFAANPDGSHHTQLTHPDPGVQDDLPDWSPDGSTIVFERVFQPGVNDNTVRDQIMRVNANGTGLTTIGSCSGNCRANDDPSYSPDGREIVISRLTQESPSATPSLGIWIMNADGSDLHQITQQQGPATAEDHEPGWSPDGATLVFTRLNDTARPRNEQALFVVSSVGGRPRRITPWSLNAGGANWAASGDRILFQSFRDCHCAETSQVYTVRPDGTRLTKLTTQGRNIEPNWSPDGTLIVFGHQPGVGPARLSDLWRMSALASRNPHGIPVIRTARWESEPDWGTAPRRDRRRWASYPAELIRRRGRSCVLASGWRRRRERTSRPVSALSSTTADAPPSRNEPRPRSAGWTSART